MFSKELTVFYKLKLFTFFLLLILINMNNVKENLWRLLKSFVYSILF